MNDKSFWTYVGLPADAGVAAIIAEKVEVAVRNAMPGVNAQWPLRVLPDGDTYELRFRFKASALGRLQHKRERECESAPPLAAFEDEARRMKPVLDEAIRTVIKAESWRCLRCAKVETDGTGYHICPASSAWPEAQRITDDDADPS